MPEQNGYYREYQGQQPVNGGYAQANGSTQYAFTRPGGAFPYSRTSSGSRVSNASGSSYVNGGQTARNVNFPTNSGIRQYQQNQDFSGNPGNIPYPDNSRFRLDRGSGQPRQGGYRNNANNNSPRQFGGSPDFRDFSANNGLGGQQAQEKAAENEVKKSGLLSLLDGVKLDPEKMTLVMLIVILARSGADITLIMALAYLLM